MTRTTEKENTMNTRKLTLPIFEAIEACAAVLPHVAGTR